jgi:hypothetical protein
MIKKYILGALIALVVPAFFAYAATPVLTAAGTDDNVTVTVTGGEINAPVVLFYNQNLAGQGTVEQRTIGTTDINGNFTGSVSTSGLGISQSSPVYVQTAGVQSLPVNWPSNTAGTTSNTNAVTFSQSSPTFAVGQSGTITLSGGGGGTFFISSNSNPNFTSASISGNTLTLSGSQLGQSAITVCSTAGPCAVVMPTFNATGIANPTTSGSVTGVAGSPTLSQGSINVSQNGQGILTVSGGAGPYMISVPSGSGISTTLIGNTLYVNGNNATGSSTLQVCYVNNGGCTPLTVNIQGTSSGTTTNTNNGIGNISFTLPITAGELTQIPLSGGIGSYYIQTPASTPAMATISGNTLRLTGVTTGTGTITVCQTGASACLPISFMVTPALTGTGGGFFYETNFGFGMTSQDVMELQTRLKDEGFFTATPTGYFGPLTQSAVMAYQSAHGIPATGYVGPLTRAQLNQ